MVRMIILLVVLIITFLLMNCLIYIKVNKTHDAVRLFSKRVTRNQIETNETLRYISNKITPIEIAKEFYKETEPYIYDADNDIRTMLKREEMQA